MKTIIEWKEIDFVIDEIIGELQDSGLTDDDIAFMPLDECIPKPRTSHSCSLFLRIINAFVFVVPISTEKNMLSLLLLFDIQNDSSLYR